MLKKCELVNHFITAWPIHMTSSQQGAVTGSINQLSDLIWEEENMRKICGVCIHGLMNMPQEFGVILEAFKMFKITMRVQSCWTPQCEGKRSSSFPCVIFKNQNR